MESQDTTEGRRISNVEAIRVGCFPTNYACLFVTKLSLRRECFSGGQIDLDTDLLVNVKVTDSSTNVGR